MRIYIKPTVDNKYMLPVVCIIKSLYNRLFMIKYPCVKSKTFKELNKMLFVHNLLKKNMN